MTLRLLHRTFSSQWVSRNQKRANKACSGFVGVCAVYKHFSGFGFFLLSGIFPARPQTTNASRWHAPLQSKKNLWITVSLYRQSLEMQIRFLAVVLCGSFEPFFIKSSLVFRFRRGSSFSLLIISVIKSKCLSLRSRVWWFIRLSFGCVTLACILCFGFAHGSFG